MAASVSNFPRMSTLNRAGPRRAIRSQHRLCQKTIADSLRGQEFGFSPRIWNHPAEGLGGSQGPEAQSPGFPFAPSDRCLRMNISSKKVHKNFNEVGGAPSPFRFKVAPGPLLPSFGSAPFR